jgi:sterol desaturase/sphingolipid hydroxylase (fatty acid hydroxylase superfamily)
MVSDELLRYIFSNSWLVYGIGGVLSAGISYAVVAFFLELCLYSDLFKSAHITYGRASDRLECIKDVHKKICFREQLIGAMMMMFGPGALLNSAIAALVLGYFVPLSPDLDLYPSWQRLLGETVLMLVINDFFLYWGHRIQHESEFLWKNMHYFHHQLGTPTPVGTVFIDFTDGALQGNLPVLFAALAVRGHPISMWLMIAIRIADNVLNHSGLDSPLLNVLFLKVLPGRGAVVHHDSHHRFSNYSTNAKNYGEFFWVWDYMFGTYSNTSAMANKTH